MSNEQINNAWKAKALENLLGTGFINALTEQGVSVEILHTEKFKSFKYLTLKFADETGASFQTHKDSSSFIVDGDGKPKHEYFIEGLVSEQDKWLWNNQRYDEKIEAIDELYNKVIYAAKEGYAFEKQKEAYERFSKIYGKDIMDALENAGVHYTVYERGLAVCSDLIIDKKMITHKDVEPRAYSASLYRSICFPEACRADFWLDCCVNLARMGCDNPLYDKLKVIVDEYKDEVNAVFDKIDKGGTNNYYDAVDINKDLGKMCVKALNMGGVEVMTSNTYDWKWRQVQCSIPLPNKEEFNFDVFYFEYRNSDVYDKSADFPKAFKKTADHIIATYTGEHKDYIVTALRRAEMLVTKAELKEPPKKEKYDDDWSHR